MTEPIETAPLRCLHCGYDLSRLSSTVCPECGEPFDEENVTLHALGLVSSPLPAWRAPDAGNLSAFFRTAGSVLLHPLRIASWLPLWPDRRCMLWYRLGCHALLFTIVISASLLSPSRRQELVFCALFIVSGWFGFSWIAAIILTSVAEPAAGESSEPLVYWRTHLDLFRIYLVVAAVLECPQLLMLQAGRSAWMPPGVLFLASMAFAAFSTWWSAAARQSVWRGIGTLIVILLQSIVAGLVVAFLTIVTASLIWWRT
jgi:hypothetical protein